VEFTGDDTAIRAPMVAPLARWRDYQKFFADRECERERLLGTFCLQLSYNRQIKRGAAVAKLGILRDASVGNGTMPRQSMPDSIDRRIRAFLAGDTDGEDLFQALYGHILDEPLPQRLRALLKH